MARPALPICLLPRRGGDKEPLVWGEAEDGGLVHISDVSSGLRCACLCPGCGARLVARKGTIMEHHFAHYRTAPCKHAYESALHKLAKEVLDGERTMLLPKVGARFYRQELTTHEQAIYQFDDAMLEHRLDQIVPDVIVRKGRSRLLVEIYVTHACGPEKIERIRVLGLSCVEVDLSRLPRDASREEVKDALLGAAPRQWIYNPKVDQAHALLRQTIARQEEEQRQVALRKAGARAAKIAQVVRAVERIRAAPPLQDERDTAAIRAVAKAGFTSAIGHALPGDDCLALPRRHWQALVMRDFVMRHMGQTDLMHIPIGQKPLFEHLRGEGLLRPDLPSFFDAGETAELTALVPGFRSPYQLIGDYLDWLIGRAILTRWDKGRWMVCESARQDWEDKKKRDARLLVQAGQWRTRAQKLVDALPRDEGTGFALDSWWTMTLPQWNTSLEAMFAFDTGRLWSIERSLDAIEALVLRGGKPVSDLLGLPVDHANMRAIDKEARRIAAEQAADAAKETAERARRRASIAKDARMALGDEAEAWLASPQPGLGSTSPITSADASIDGYYSASGKLAEAARVRSARLDRERLRKQLLDAADGARKPAHARLFLTSPNPAWHNRHPIESCVDETSFERLRRAMIEVAR